MKIMIIGDARHGKDAAAEILARRFGFRHTSSSMWAAKNVVMEAFNTAHCQSEGQGPYYSSVEECFADRVNHRAFWFDVISTYCAENGARLIQGIFAEHDIYVGCRNARELYRAKNMGIIDLVLWIERPGFPREDRSSNNLEPWMAETIIYNDGTLEDLERQLAELMMSKFGCSQLA